MRAFKGKLVRFSLMSASLAAIAVSATPAMAQAQVREFNIPAQTLSSALLEFSRQSDVLIVVAPELAEGKRSPALHASLPVNEAIARLLVGSGLRAVPNPRGGYRIERSLAARNNSSQPTSSIEEDSVGTEEGQIVVTGTRIRGAQLSSPVTTITQNEMRLSGQNNLGEVIRALPQNFSGGQNPGVLTGADGGSVNQNLTGSSSLNLRGLGADATLTLLNGARMAYDGNSQATDVAVIPVAAIDRFEVLLDGASAIYGSDAIGGVANIILKRNYDGLELAARFGQATDGGDQQAQLSAVAGKTWGSGGILIAGEVARTSNVRASQREYLDYIKYPDQLTVYPETKQEGVLISGHQNLGKAVEMSLDAFYTHRTNEVLILQSTLFGRYAPDVSIFGISPSVRILLPKEWSMRVYGFYGKDISKSSTVYNLITTGAVSSSSASLNHNAAKSAGVEFEGALFSLPGGSARISLGGGWRRANYEQGNLITGVATIKGSNSNSFAYGEAYFPLVGENQEIPLVRRLSFNAAIRYDDYDRFGGATTPKVGMFWQISPSLDIRASWGRSFKAPRTLEQFQSRGLQLRTAASVGLVGAPSTATILTASGGNADLGPERAEVITAGLTFRPTFLPGATLEFGWFNIDYTDRVVTPLVGAVTQLGQLLGNPNFSEFYVLNPSQAQQDAAFQAATSPFNNLTGAAYNPSNVVALFNGYYTNAAKQHTRGIDLNFKYSFSAMGGSLSINTGGSWITDSQRVLVAGTSAFDIVGLVGYPSKLKGRAGLNWSRANFSAGAIVNYLGGVRDTRLASSPMGKSMTTVDVIFDLAAGRQSGLGVNLSIINAFNQRPPYMTPSQPYYVNFDSTNYSALGRVINLTLTKRF